MPVSRQNKPDYPLAAHAKAVRAFDDFEACAAEYRLMLDTHRSLLSNENFDGVLDTIGRGDRIANRAAMCSRRVTPVRDALQGGKYAGPRTAELQRRLATVNIVADLIGTSVNQLSAACVVKRDEAAGEIARDQVQSARATSVAAYGVSRRAPAAIDVRH